MLRSRQMLIALGCAVLLYSNIDLLLHGKAEWQAPASSAALIGTTGADRSFVISSVAFVIAGAMTAWALSNWRAVSVKPAKPQSQPPRDC